MTFEPYNSKIYETKDSDMRKDNPFINSKSKYEFLYKKMEKMFYLLNREDLSEKTPKGIRCYPTQSFTPQAKDRPRSIPRTQNANEYYPKINKTNNRLNNSFIGTRNSSFLTDNMQEYEIIKGPKNVVKSYYIQEERQAEQNELHICEICKNKSIIFLFI